MATPVKMKVFKKLVDSLTNQNDRAELISDFVLKATPKLSSRILDARLKTDITWAISEFKKSYFIETPGRNKKTLPTHLIYRIYLLSEFPIDIVNQYVMRGNQCFRHKLLRGDSQHVKKTRTVYKAKRRPSIYGWNGDLVPRTYLDKLSTPIRNQNDYDRMKQKELGMTYDEYLKRNNLQHLRGNWL